MSAGYTRAVMLEEIVMHHVDHFVLPPLTAEPRLRAIAEDATRLVQSSLFASHFLPRQLPVFKYGPEDDTRATRH